MKIKLMFVIIFLFGNFASAKECSSKESLKVLSIVTNMITDVFGVFYDMSVPLIKLKLGIDLTSTDHEKLDAAEAKFKSQKAAIFQKTSDFVKLNPECNEKAVQEILKITGPT